MIKTDPTTWNTHVTHPLQSWEWGEFRKKMGIDVVRINGWQITFHPVPYTRWTIGYFPKGPKPTKEMLQKLKEIGESKHAIFIQIEPNVPKRSEILDLGSNILKPSHRPLFTKYTFVLDLTPSEEELQKNLHPKTRYNIRVAQKHGVVISEDNSKNAFRAYLALTTQTTHRQGFYAHSPTYHEHMWTTMREAGIAHQFTASYQGEILAVWILFSWKNQLFYPYGASSRNHRETMAPTLLLWEIMRWAKNKGFTSLDLWGALGPDPDPTDPWFGFHRFKQGFNPKLVEFIGSYDLVVQPWAYTLYTFADTLRWTLLNAKRKIAG